ncbi:MAG: AAA family ATPase [bacterium]|nr:AAA family ATPase [bacterium]
MDREFNTTGICYPHMHYMADRSAKIKEIVSLIEKGKYFTINRPRQYGKTTVLFQVEKELDKMGYLALSISFEGTGERMFSNEERFAVSFLKMLRKALRKIDKRLANSILPKESTPTSLDELSDVISEMIETANKRVVLQIDEVDSSSNNQLFLRFLGMLRAKYLARGRGPDDTFFSVILAGVHDVKNLKLKIRPEVEHQLNSPWNIAIDFEVDLNFSPGEIADMLTKYTVDRTVTLDIPFFSGQLFYLTSGYPFLVSYLCKVIDEKLLPQKKEKTWEPDDLEKALQITLKSDNTNFQSLIVKLENNPELYELVYKIIMNDQDFSYNRHNKIMSFAFMYGILQEENGGVKVHNRLYEQMIYNYMASNLETSGKADFDSVSSTYIRRDGSLDIGKVILKFQEFMKEQYSRKDTKFIERNGRLLFLTFLKPIINGKGYDFKEVQVSEEKRLDIVVTYSTEKFIIELKKWYGEKAHQNGLNQLADYLERQNLDSGYLLIYDARKKSNRIGENKTVTIQNKQIFMAWV